MTESGVLLVDKSEGPSSAQVVNRAKKILGAKKVGHLGTLDPFASGLLLLGVNEGTKVADIFLHGSKTYEGVIALGIETDTQDRTGKVVSLRPLPQLKEDDLETLADKFTGVLEQVPPMFSALKKNGVRLYRLARQGKEVVRAPRRVKIEELRLHKLNDAEIEFHVVCSHGTYIRTLAADMGKYLGCGGHVKQLRRLACGHLSLERAFTLDQLDALSRGPKIPLLSLSSALAHLREFRWQSQWISRLRSGQQEILAQLGMPRAGESAVRVVTEDGALAAVIQWREDPGGGRWQIFRVFHG